jgi:hypothetical protein
MAKKKTGITISLVFFTIFSIVTLFFLYNALATPIEETRITPLYTYENQGTYTGLATLEPNAIYNNATTLELDEGSIFRRITDRIDINFTYHFEGNIEANFTVQYYIYEFIETSSWTKQFIELPEQIVESTGTSLNFSVTDIPTVNFTLIQSFVNKISDETGLYSSQYSLNITTEIDIAAETSVGTIYETFTPTMKIEFRTSASEGEIIFVTGLVHAKTEQKIQKTDTVYNQEVQQQRNFFYAGSTTALFGLIVSVWFFMKTGPQEPPKPEKLLEDVIAPYEEIIVEASQGPSEKEQVLRTANTVPINTLEDLVKIADTLNKPIIHMHKPPETQIFYIIDGLTKYEFTTTFSAMEKEKATVEKEEEDE